MDQEFQVVENNLEGQQVNNKINGGPVERSPRTTSPYLSKYEKARVLGTRALQLSMGAPPQVELHGETDTYRIALKELYAKKINLVVRRYFANKDWEDWSVDELLLE
ncbi:DNA directed RNA polymeras-like protein II polypeptide F [Conidiobolus coronatus NRRL 28638]|uniref:DNA directed RNA polymeras-like protein II polypeptide F n=1 Tax=Conidiobolus coronatus (strain ATCC 28846 / CBS 209.66 / NRRL 28638) TaxID=796925 RepID=A0A137P451_CONC2|nr:DNA directed RNA polymeras-like protein II polypeptide F [Conidiobolus coronatus NRRL 28638]|eukprot:KXN69792.1 DNA directed RNA polymeras-like protein II polypeptide F [Conidiobolus coronatus NRRL 28638]